MNNKYVSCRYNKQFADKIASENHTGSQINLHVVINLLLCVGVVYECSAYKNIHIAHVSICIFRSVDIIGLTMCETIQSVPCFLTLFFTGLCFFFISEKYVEK